MGKDGRIGREIEDRKTDRRRETVAPLPWPESHTRTPQGLLEPGLKACQLILAQLGSLAFFLSKVTEFFPAFFFPPWSYKPDFPCPPTSLASKRKAKRERKQAEGPWSHPSLTITFLPILRVPRAPTATLRVTSTPATHVAPLACTGLFKAPQ